jgi:hypothetical protein
MPKKRASAAHRPVDDEVEEDDQEMNGDHDESASVEQEEDGEDDTDQHEDDEEMDEEEDDEEDDEEMKEDEEKNESPSPRMKRGMTMRSGKRKRGRSKDTTGLTPEEKLKKQTASPTRASKRARKSTAKAAAAATTASTTAKKAPPTPAPEEQQREQSAEEPTPAVRATTDGTLLNSTTGATPSSETSPAGVPDPRRISYAAGAKLDGAKAPMARHEEAPENEDSEEEIQAPPPMNGGPAAASYTKTTTVTTSQAVVENAAAPAAAVEVNDAQSVEETAVEDEKEEMEGGTPTERSRMIVRVGFMTALALTFFILHPLFVKLANVIVPLDPSILPPKVDITDAQEVIEEEIFIEEVDLPPHEMEAWNANFQQRLQALQTLEDDYRRNSNVLSERYNYVQRGMQDMLSKVQHQVTTVQQKVQELTELESLLFNDMAHEGEHSDEQQWHRIQTMATAAGKPLLETSTVQVWSVPELEEESCADLADNAAVEVVDDEEENESILTTKLLDEKESDLLLRAQMSAEKIMTGDAAKDQIRKWVKQTIDKSLKGNSDADAAMGRISELSTALETAPKSDGVTSSSGGISAQTEQDVENAIQARLEIDRADTTGIFDHASLKNGAEIIFGGKRGTSQSLVDNLPIYNRLLQSFKLRFYGFGPEAALSPSYPANTLGHCWSFQPLSLHEQLKERERFQDQRGVPNDFKRGGFGTLTISFATPVFVSSVVIEHIPQRLTDRADTAIRSFRVVGYEDESATTKAWNLGSFEYSIQKNGNHQYLQEFEVATTARGEEIPSLHSISLAVDSNWGHDYACLYRFRVHGEEDPDEDDD